MLLLAAPLSAQSPDASARIAVDAGHVENHITTAMTGSCIEDVNHEIYGGLYDQKIFGERFAEPPSDPVAGWKTFGGLWQVDDGVCRVEASDGAKLRRDAPDFADGIVEADVRFSAQTDINAGLLLHVRNAGVGADNFDGYEVSLSPSAQQVILGKHRHDWHPIQNTPAAVTTGGWNHLRVRLDGPRLRIYVNGATEPAIDYTDADAPLVSGGVALRTWYAKAAFRDFRVATPQGTDAPRFAANTANSVSGMWDPIVSESAAAEFAWQRAQTSDGFPQQTLRHGPGAGRIGIANRGLNRWGISVRKGQSLAGRVYLHGSALTGPVTIALQSAIGTRTYATAELRDIGSERKKYAFTLTPNATDANARFALYLDKPGSLFVDQVVLMGTGAERFHGLPVRADIAQSLVSEGVTFLRYGGTMVNAPGYRWKNMIGDPDRRPPYRGHWYPYSTNGFGIFDFLSVCEAAHIEAAFAINIEESDGDAADLADYLTAPTTNPWGRRRAEDGHPAPYHVAYIEIGNEEVLGGDRHGEQYAHYADRFRALSAAIHARNPTLKLVCAAWWDPRRPGMREVFDAIDGKAAAWDLHVDSDEARAGTAIDARLTQMQSLFQKWNPQTALKAVVFEENGGRHDQQRALGHATTLNATRRHGDFVLADCPANCLQPYQQNDNGWDQGQIFFTADHVWAMPPYYAQQMASQNYQPLRVESVVTGNGPGTHALDVLSTRSEDGKTLVLSVVNVSSDAVPAAISLTHFENRKANVSTWTLAAEPDAVNPPDGPETVHPQAGVVRTVSPNVDYNFPPYSFTVLRFTR